MKKNKFLKMFLTFVCILAISIVSEHVYGYQLKYKAYANNNYVYFLSMGNAYGAPDPTPNFINTDQLVDLTKTSIYQSYKFMLQSNPTTNYSSNNRI